MKIVLWLIRGVLLQAFLFLLASSANAALLTFDDIVSGATSYAYDADGDATDDVVFSTTDPGGFNSVGPGTNMSYINEPGIEGTVSLSPDLRVDFNIGAVNQLGFGFALSSGTDNVVFTVYDSSDNVLATETVQADYTLPDGSNPSSYPEAHVSVSFSGVAAYATFDFDDNGGRYIIDNFEGTFGSTEADEIAAGGASIPTLSEWGMIIMSILLGITAIVYIRRQRMEL